MDNGLSDRLSDTLRCEKISEESSSEAGDLWFSHIQQMEYMG